MNEENALLVEQARRGDKEAFAVLYRQYQHTIYSLIWHLTANPEAAADLTQETFVKAWHALPRLKTHMAFGGWLRIIALNLVRDYSRRHKPEQSLLEHTSAESNPREAADVNPGPEEEIIRSQEQKIVREAVSRLPESQRLVIVMHHFEDKPVAEIAAELKLPIGTVLSRLARGREALRRRLGKLVETED